ncbi:MAG: hypothetical protein A2509_07590 [Candidatus Edwardsbacteria bacterium RIFOXYD12_FULL_50_11]|uniref:Uncharacterized protein n=1 Tax=Candidatus Edwardsbacteria bacterium GWF2_54_11 TaxID=1817851 RepID=A0A1F5RE05_9BACT|nr:MAG: hypothetical protein A2502_00465 [Candidatus Edwardsbacteria bacterium RifOxyC12_full_54_24]OGF06095.1 MAG: hypothetical protein A2273_09935 [Candidatus Edwardsbacteria bacterium RifOxyA12_full_54_48]OGF12677.1 MAG: hypothetical protein A2024_00400 [Candidatus Edwardsbacteria bacterium GWF2_54_11]OGF17136.1 MAG: hypothetical protein A2509_07590 [Candidatus Edwardsbacteria bacterium RIFOXYD12_FULL_50_11]OGJ18335.1 MAG: hypothetical protein A2349_11780 [Candidatus Edwardsbacteria bacteriu
MIEILFLALVIWWVARFTVKFLRGIGEAIGDMQKNKYLLPKGDPPKPPPPIRNYRPVETECPKYQYNDYLRDQGMSEQDIEDYWDSKE